MIDYLFPTYLVLSPVIYATLAGRAKMNLIDETTWHYWAFRAFILSMLTLLAVWLATKKEIACG